MEVLIIKDDRIISNLIKQELEKYCIETTIANTGIQAYKNLYNKKFDFVVLDLYLPDENGIIIGNWLNVNSESKIILHTAITHENYKNRCKYDYFIEKGNEIDEVVNIIKKEFFKIFS